MEPINRRAAAAALLGVTAGSIVSDAQAPPAPPPNRNEAIAHDLAAFPLADDIEPAEHFKA